MSGVENNSGPRITGGADLLLALPDEPPPPLFLSPFFFLFSSATLVSVGDVLVTGVTGGVFMDGWLPFGDVTLLTAVKRDLNF